MKIIELHKIEHLVKVGDSCPMILPNIKEDCMLQSEGQIIGFFIKQLSKYSIKASQLADLANKELQGKGVPKTKMNRGTQKQAREKGIDWISQYSTIIGSVPPKAHMRRPYPTTSSVHAVKSANTFIKAMIMLGEESEELVKKLTPQIYENQIKLIQENCGEKWRFGKMFTSSISNFNISAPYHKDNGNIQGCVNVIITKRLNAIGGNLNVPDYGATFDSCDNSMLVYPAWKNIHGVTPIVPTFEGGYRNSLIFYPLKAFKGL